MINLAPHKSFFVGPTAFYRGRERRKWWRRFSAIIELGHTEPIELILALAMLHNGLVLLLGQDHSGLPIPTFFGVLSLCGALTGFAGLATRAMELRLTFAFGGIILRCWMTWIYFFTNWFNPAWGQYFTGAILCIWLATRLVCKDRLRRMRISQRNALCGDECDGEHCGGIKQGRYDG